jgi:hypothetical protein
MSTRRPISSRVSFVSNVEHESVYDEPVPEVQIEEEIAEIKKYEVCVAPLPLLRGACLLTATVRTLQL